MKPHKLLNWMLFGLAIIIFSSCKSDDDSSLIPVKHGQDVNETNTGVPAGHTLSNATSTIVVTEEWIESSNDGKRTIENLLFTDEADLTIKVNNFTVKYCKFFGKSNAGVEIGMKNITFEDCEFDGNHENIGGDVALYGSGITAKRVHIHRWPRAMWVGDGDVWIEGCYMHDLTCDDGDAHLENIYVAGGANQTYLCNKFISNEIHLTSSPHLMTSASLAIYNESYSRGVGYPDFPALDNILLEDNYFESDGQYAMYGGACIGKAAPYAKNMKVRGNVFGRGLHKNCGISGIGTAFDPSQPGNVWENNTWGPRGVDWQTGDPEEGDEVSSPGPS
jgi:hypothetical protein